MEANTIDKNTDYSHDDIQLNRCFVERIIKGLQDKLTGAEKELMIAQLMDIVTSQKEAIKIKEQSSKLSPNLLSQSISRQHVRNVSRKYNDLINT